MSFPARSTLQPAYLLHCYPYLDTSLLVEVLTGNHGRLGLVARGGRGPATRHRPFLQPFRPLLISWSGRGELGTLTGCEGHGPAIVLQGTSLYSGFYMNELLLRLVARQDPHAGLFQHYEQALQGLGLEDGQRALRLFEKRLLEALGYGLQLKYDAADHRPLNAAGTYEFRLEHGLIAVAGEQHASRCFSGKSLISLQREELS